MKRDTYGALHGAMIVIYGMIFGALLLFIGQEYGRRERAKALSQMYWDGESITITPKKTT